MSNGLYSGVSGLALGVGLYKGVSGLWGGASGLIDGFGGGGGLPTDGSPTLILDFVGGNVPYGATLGLDFTGQTYTAYSADPSASGFANFWAWS